MKTIPFYTQDELQRIEWFRLAPPCHRQEMLEVYEAILRGVEEDGGRISLVITSPQAYHRDQIVLP